MVQGMTGTWLRRLLGLLAATSGAALAWRARRRSVPELSARTWSKPLPAPAAVEPVDETARPAPTPGLRLGPCPGSALPLDDGSAPSPEFVVKGNVGSMRSHSSGSPYFGRTRAEVWFRTEGDALAAGFRPWSRTK